MTMVERVARALAREWSRYHFDRDDDVTWEEHISSARAAIAVMREPTEGMKRATLGGAYLSIERSGADESYYLDSEGASEVFRDMIDAALEEKSPPS